MDSATYEIEGQEERQTHLDGKKHTTQNLCRKIVSICMNIGVCSGERTWAAIDKSRHLIIIVDNHRIKY